MKNILCIIAALITGSAQANPWNPLDTPLSEYQQKDLYLTGKSIHGSSHPHRERLNEDNYGVGVGVSTAPQDGHSSQYYLLHFQDSFKKGQTMAGFSHLMDISTPYAQLGYTIGIMHKPSKLDTPTPYLMPLLQIGTEQTHVLITGLPKMPKVQNTQVGDILFIFARQTF